MKRLFVAMPYGKRKAPLDYEEPDQIYEIDFNAVWQEILQPAVPASFETKRADELKRPGLIDRMYNEWLFDADIVLADLTFGNPNVYYELGIRQALSKKGTVLVACRGTKLPFDVRNQYVIEYDYFAAPTLRAFQGELRQAIENVSTQEVDSPVHVFLPDLFVGRYRGEKPPEARIQELTQRVLDLEATLRDQGSRGEEERLLDKLRDATTAQDVLRHYHRISTREIKSIRLLEKMAIRLRSFSYFDEALQILDRALKIDPDDSEIIREMGFVYRKKGPQFYPQAETYLERAVQLDDKDSEALGMLGGLFRRRGEYERALSAYRRAHESRGAHESQPEDLYPLVTIGAMCGALGKVEEANEWYKRLQTLCEKLISEKRADHWTFLCLGEAAVVFGDQEAANIAYQKALSSNPAVEDVRSEAEQLEFLIGRNFAKESALVVLPILQEYLLTHASR